MCMRYETRENASVGSRFDASDAFWSREIWTVIILWFKPRAWLMIRWTLSPRDPRAVFIAFLIQRFSVSHVACNKRINVEHSPKRWKWKRGFSLKGVTDVKVSLNPNYRMLICTITLILRVNINMHVTCHIRATQALVWVRVALSRGPSATSHPRGSRVKIYPLFNLF